MFNENLKNLRQRKGFTQEELAIRLHVVRQTVSKWEKGLSVPDAVMLKEIAEILEVSVSELLGADIREEEKDDNNILAQQLMRINEQLAVANSRGRTSGKILRGLLIALLSLIVGIILFLLIMGTLGMASYHNSLDSSVHLTTEWESGPDVTEE